MKDSDVKQKITATAIAGICNVKKKRKRIQILHTLHSNHYVTQNNLKALHGSAL